MNHENIHISTDIIINAKKEVVWKVLSDIENWTKWTSIILSVKGSFEKDGLLNLEFVNPEGGSFQFERSIFHFEEGFSFGWTGEAFAGLKDFHIFQLESLPSGDTKFTQSDGMHGADFPGIAAIELQMLEGYKIFNQDIKAYIESL